MNRRRRLTFLTAFFLAGCSQSAPEHSTVPERESGRSAATDSTTAYPGQEGVENNETRLSVGPVSFTPPPGWEVRQATEAPGISIFAPVRPEWDRIGFRVNCGVLRRPHPGVPLERYAELLEQAVSQSAEQFNANVIERERALSGRDGPEISLKAKGEHSLVERSLDGARVLSTTYSGTFHLPNGPVAMKTFGIQYLNTDALYTISLAFPQEMEEEMRPVWLELERSVRIDE
jgi:hypothetical protein